MTPIYFGFEDDLICDQYKRTVNQKLCKDLGLKEESELKIEQTEKDQFFKIKSNIAAGNNESFGYNTAE